MSLKKIVIGFGLWGLFCLAGNGLNNIFAAEMVDRIVAVVNDEVISLYDVNRYQASHPVPNTPAGTPAADPREALKRLIEEKLVAQEIQRLGIRVSPEEIDAQLSAMKSAQNFSDSQFEAALASEGFTIENYREFARKQILRAKLIGRKIKSRAVVTRTDVEKAYAAAPEKYIQGTRYRLRNIIVPLTPGNDTRVARQKIDGARAALDQGEDFKTVAATYTIAEMAADGGDLGWFEGKALSPEIAAAIEDLNPGEYTQVLKTSQGYQIFLLETREKGHARSLDDVYAKIEQQLYNNLVEEKYRQWVEELHQKAYIRVMP